MPNDTDMPDSWLICHIPGRYAKRLKLICQRTFLVQTASKTAHPFSRKVLPCAPCPHPPQSRAVKPAFHARRRRCPAWAGASQEPADRWSRAGEWQPGSSPASLGSVRCEKTEFTCFNLTQCSQHTQMHRQMLRSTRRCARYASFELLEQR